MVSWCNHLKWRDKMILLCQHVVFLSFVCRTISIIILGLSTRALKPDSLDPDPQSAFIGSRVSSTRYTNYVHCHCTAGLNLKHCHTSQCAARIRTKAMWRQSGLWIQISDPHRIRIQGPVWKAPLSFNHRTFNLSCFNFQIAFQCLMLSTT